jgi:hypothetical protein
VAGRLDKIDAGVNAVVDHLGSIDAVLLLKVGVEAGLDVVDYRLPAVARISWDEEERHGVARLSSLLTKSPVCHERLIWNDEQSGAP